MEDLILLLKDLGSISGEIAGVVANVLKQQLIPLVSIVMIVYSVVWAIQYSYKSEEQSMEALAGRMLGLFGRLFLLVWGVTLLGYVDTFCIYLENAVSYTEDRAISAVADDFNKKANTLLQNNGLDWKEYSSAEMLFIEKSTVDNIENSHKLMTEQNVEAIQNREKQLEPSNIAIDGTEDYDAGMQYKNTAESLQKMDAAQHQVDEDGFSFFSMDLDEMLAYIFSFFGLLVQVVIRALRLVFLVVFKVAFPLVVLISIFPTKSKVLGQYFEHYTTFLFWTVVIILVEIANKVVYATLTMNGDGDANNALVIAFGVIMCVTYTIVPNISVMLFGGNTVTATVFSAVTGTVSKYLGISYLTSNLEKAANKKVKSEAGMMGNAIQGGIAKMQKGAAPLSRGKDGLLKK